MAKSTAYKRAATPAAASPRLLSGGNPQIPKGVGDAPVQAYIAAAPGWKGVICERLDTLITDTVPGIKKAVKWNTPLYGLDGETWILGYHLFDRYVKVTFFRGASLKPLPPGTSKQKNVRYCDIHEGEWDETQLRQWLKQAIKLPGEKL
ncbi:MAG: DUF1801 domain-containing protein [Flavobacteriales bacterium]|nr:DUF1801 domain-containing protein [Flavobacteriales bacterium]